MGTIRGRAFRHTYATLRHECQEDGRAVGWKTVADELGHTSWRQLEGRYARHRPKVTVVGGVMEVRVEDYAEALAKWPPARRQAVSGDLCARVWHHTPRYSDTTPGDLETAARGSLDGTAG